MKIYVASKFEDHARARSMMECLTALGHEITFDWTVYEKVDRYALEGQAFDNFMMTCAVNDIRGAVAADVIVFLWNPACQGAFIEMGTVQLSKPVVVLKTNGRQRSNTVFLWLPNVTVVTTKKELFAKLQHLAEMGNS